jgi:hypothetical protein
MRNGILGSLVALLAAAGLAGAQPTPERSTPPADGSVGKPAPLDVSSLENTAPLPAQKSSAGVASASDGSAAAAPAPTKGAPAPTPPPVLDADGLNKLGAPEYCDVPHPHATKPEGICLDGHIWVHAEYLLWWVENGPLKVPLVTTGPPASLGILGRPGTTVLFGNNDLDYGVSSGGRFTIGVCEPTELIGVEADAFFLLRRSANLGAASNAGGNPLLARPFFDTTTGRENVQLVSAPGAFSGNIAISSSTRMFGAELNGILAVLGTCHFNVDAIAGFRYLDLDEDLSIQNSTTLLGGGQSAINGMPLFAPASTVVGDEFQTRNQFYGGQFGAQVEGRFGNFYMDLLAKLAVGGNHEKVSVNGSTTATVGSTSTTVPGGLLALPSNIGKNYHDEVALVPEFQATVGYQICKTIRLFAGYDFLYWSNVVRPGEQIDRVVNATHIPTNGVFTPTSSPNEPIVTVHQSQMWVQGLHVGITLRY